MFSLRKKPYSYKPIGDDRAADNDPSLHPGAENTSLCHLKHHIIFIQNTFTLLAAGLFFGLLGFVLGQSYANAGNGSLIPSKLFQNLVCLAPRYRKALRLHSGCSGEIICVQYNLCRSSFRRD